MTDLTMFFQEIYFILNQQHSHSVIMLVYLVLVLVAIGLRVMAHLHFRGLLLAFQLDARKEIKNRGEVSNLKFGLLRKVTAEYIRIADKAVTTVPTKELVNRAVGGISLVGWKYENIIPFVESLDNGLLLVGLVLAFIFNSQAFVYGSLAIVAFLITRISAAFFNARGAKEQLADELLLFIEREVGQFFASDSGGAVLRLKNDLTEAINNQAKTYKETMALISNNMTNAMDNVATTMINAANAIGPIVAKAMDEKLINMNTTLSHTLDDWEHALQESSKSHMALNDSTERLAHSSSRIQSASELLATHMQGHSNALSEQLLTLVSAITATKEGLDTLATQQASLTKQAQYIEMNQHTLENSLASYEASLQNLTQSLGDGLGAFINLHAQTSAKAVNDALKNNIDRILNMQNPKGGEA